MGESAVESESWREEVVRALQAIEGLLARLVAVAERPERPVEKEPAADIKEQPDNGEPLATWILTDQRVSAIEGAIEQEERVRGRAYGG